MAVKVTVPTKLSEGMYMRTELTAVVILCAGISEYTPQAQLVQVGT